jgi:uncharacterized protein YcfJ
MKKTVLTLALIGGAGMAFANPGPATSFPARGEVISSTPIYESINEPRRECWNEQVGVEAPRQRDYGGAVLGGLFGGLLGHQMGRGSGRDWGTAVGAATGAIVGDNIDNRQAGGTVRNEQHCRQIDNWSRRLTGYNVTYRYEGQTFATVLPYDPGPSVHLNVNVSVADH